MASHFRGTPFVLRFIEYMDVGNTNGWNMDEVIPSAEVIRRINTHWPLEEVPAHTNGETAKRWRYCDGQGEIGVISSVTEAFCQDCTRLRLSIEGKIFTCLFATEGHDLRSMLRGGASDGAIANAIQNVWLNRQDRYSEQRKENTLIPAASKKKIEMSYIGG